MNKVILVGRLAQDPEVRYTATGKAVATFSLAVSRRVGQGQESTDFIPIVSWEKLAEICGNNLTKGRRILVEGRLQIRSYEAQDGQKRRAPGTSGESGTAGNSQNNQSSNQQDGFGFGPSIPEEDIPF